MASGLGLSRAYESGLYGGFLKLGVPFGGFPI